MATLAGITIEEYERLPDALAHNNELVDGKLVDVSGNTFGHNRLRDRLLTLLIAPVEQELKIGMIVSEQEFDFKGNAHGPDVSFIGTPKCHLFDDERRVQLFVPDLAIEIVSKNDTFEGLTVKAVRYRQCGTQEVWILSPATREALALSNEGRAYLGDDQMFKSKLIPGFGILLADLFDRA